MSGASDRKIVLVVADDHYAASDTPAALRGAAAEVLDPRPTVDEALRELGGETPSAVVLDQNLGAAAAGLKSAVRWSSQSKPLVLLTGYDPVAIPDELAFMVRLQKPVALHDFVEDVSKL
ncbi:response regulator [Agrobacterium pusense]|uniref:response regulator n=1 Tax=Agrobacterium pusense TaxID=648995 RepID=UPI003FD515D7